MSRRADVKIVKGQILTISQCEGVRIGLGYVSISLSGHAKIVKKCVCRGDFNRHKNKVNSNCH